MDKDNRPGRAPRGENNRGFRWILGISLGFLVIAGLVGCAVSGGEPVADDASPAPTPGPPPGLGIDRETLIGIFNDDFAFKPPSTTSDGTPIVEGTTLLGQEMISLIGPPENLSRILLIAVPDTVDSNEQRMQNLRRAVLLLHVVPDWEDASGWMTSQFHTLGSGEIETVDTDGKRIAMHRRDHEGLAVYGLDITAIER